MGALGWACRERGWAGQASAAAGGARCDRLWVTAAAAVVAEGVAG